MKTARLLWTIPVLGMLAMPAVAGKRHHDDTGSSRIEQRLDRQHWRIKEGIRSGELTRKEAKRLRRQQRHIGKLERRFTHDGHLDRYERRTLRRELDAASAEIYRLKHNDRYRERDDRVHKDRYDHGHRHDRVDDVNWSVAFRFWDVF